MSRWMIYCNGRHDGPYTEAELQAKIAAHQIDGDTPTWSAGRDQYEPLRACLPHLIPSSTPPSHSAGWQLKSGDRTIGPLSRKEVRALARAGALSPDTLIRRGSDQEWQPLFPGQQPTPTPPVNHETDSGSYTLMADPPSEVSIAARVGTTELRGQLTPASSASTGHSIRQRTQSRGRGILLLALVCGAIAVGWMLVRAGSARILDGSLEGVVRRNTSALARLGDALGNPSCSTIERAARAMVDAQRALLDHPDLPRYVADQRWLPLGKQLEAAHRDLSVSFGKNKSKVSAALSGCDDANLSALLSETLSFKDRMNQVIVNATMQKMILDTQRQADRERLGIPEPTPHSCAWCKRPMTHGQWLASLYCSPKCERESR